MISAFAWVVTQTKGKQVIITLAQCLNDVEDDLQTLHLIYECSINTLKSFTAFL
jgi:hypothetical protein